MRISTTPLILICSVFFLGFTSGAFAQSGAPGTPPKFQVTHLQHTCGPGTPTSGSITVTITDGDPAQGSLTVSAQVGINPPITQTIPIPPGFPATPIITTLNGLSGNPAGGARSYLVLVQDADNSSISDGGANYNIFNFQTSLGSKVDNTSSNCATPNGAINVTLAGNTGVAERPILYSWSGPAGFTDPGTKDLTGLVGGDYTLTYKDSNSPATSCSLGPIHINDPTPPDYNNLPGGTSCGGDALGLDLNTLKKATSVTASSFELVSVTSTGLTTGSGITTTPGTVLNATDLADDVWLNSDVTSHNVTYTLKTFLCLNQGNTITVTYAIAPQPVYNNIDATAPGICSNTSLGVTLDAAKVNLTASSYTVTNVVSTGLTAVSGIVAGTPYAATNTSLSDDVWQNVNTTFRDVIYTITPKIGSCSGSPFTVTVRINPQPAAADANRATCSNVALNIDIQSHYSVNGNNLSGTTFQWQAADNTFVTGETLTTQTTTSITDVLVNTSTINQLVIYTVTPKTGSCVGNPFKINVTVNPQPAATDGTKTICSKDAVAFDLQNHLDVNGNAIALSTFSWFADDNTSVSGESLTPQASGTINDPLINTGSTSQPVVYHVTPKSPGGCVGTAFKVTVTVNPQPVSPDITKTICSTDNVNVNLQTQGIDLGNAIANTTFSWSAGDNTFVTGESLTAQTTQSIGDALVNTSAITQVVTYTVTPTSPASALCVGNTFTVTVTVSAKPVYSNYTDASGICADPIGVDLDARKAATSVLASAYDVFVFDHTGLTAAGGSPALTLIADAPTGEIADDVWSNVTTIPHNVIYQITPKAGSCVGTSFTVTVSIKPQPDYASKPVTVCSSDAVGYDLNGAKNAASVVATVFTITNIVPDAGLVATTGPAALNTPLSNTAIQNDVWKNTTNADLFVKYTVVPKESTCSGAPFDITVTIHPEPVYTAITLADECSEDVIGLDLNDQKAATSIAATQFNFTTVSGALIPIGTTTTTGNGNNMIIADDQWRNVTNAAIQLEYTITPVSVDGCDGVPFKVTLNINPQPDYKNYNDDNVPGGICAVPLAIDITTLQKPGTVPATSFTFTMPAPAGLTLVTDGGTPSDLSDDVWSNGTSGNLIVTYHITPSVGGCDGDPFDVNVTILPTPDYNNYANNNAPGGVCSGDVINVDITTLKKPLSAIASSFAVVPNSSGMPQTAGAATPNDLTDDAWQNTGNTTVDVVYTITPKAGTCDGAPFTVTVTINPEPNSIDLAWQICTGNAINFDLQTDGINTGGNGITSTFQWSALDNTNVSGETTSLTSSGTLTDVLTNNVTTDQDVIYTVTPTSTGGCTGQPFKVTVTVATKPVLGTNAPANLCSGSPVNYAIQLTPAGQPVGTTFTWFAVMDYPNITGESTTIQPGATIADVLVNTGITAQTVDYTVTPALGGCIGTSKNIQITVYPGLIANAGNDQTICDDFTGYFLAGASISGAATSFQWFIETNPGDATLDPPTDVNDPSTAQFHATIEGNYILRLETNIDPSGLCSQGVDHVTITVTKKPVITPGPQLKTICGNDLVAYEILMDQRDFNQASVFTWGTPNDPTGVANAKPSPPGGIPMGPLGTIHINDELRNETNGNIDITYTVTVAAGLCLGNTEDIVITVKPSPVVAFGQTKTICSGERVDYEILLAPVNTPGGTKFSWPDPDGSGSATSQKDILADPAGTLHILDTLYNFDPAGLPATVRYQIISQGVNGCYGRTRDLDISVNSGAIANAGAPQSICSDGVLTLSTASVSGSATFAWNIIQQPAFDGVITNGATAQASTFKGTTAGVYKLQLTTGAPTSGVCNAVSDVVTITVKPIGDPACTGTGPGTCTTTATITVTDATCNNNDGSIKVENVAGGTAPYTYTLNGTIVNLPADNTFKGLTANTYTLDITDATSCTKTFSTVVSWPGFVAHYTPKITNPDCTANGTNGSIRLVISDPGSFEFAFTEDLINEPLTYNKVGDSIILVPDIAAGDYAIWMRPLGAGLKCTTKVFASVDGVREVTYAALATNVICFSEQTAVSVSDIKGAAGLPFAYTLTNTNDNSVRTGTISASQALSTYSITGVTKGNYSLLITQDQSSVVSCIAPIVGSPVALVVDAPVAALDTLYVKKTISVPDLPSGAALVGVAPSGREPYEVRLELVQPVFASQQYVMDWTEVPLNPQNLKFEYNFKSLYAGDYVLGLRDSLGCQKTYAFSLDVDTQLFIPNIFTPNEDGHNDTFYIRNLPTDAKLLVTNRWGNEIYKSGAYQNDWGGADAVDGIYYYTVTVGKEKYTGWVEILRAQ
jgi:gliding motility-associated-like protein